jgi:hypothetical protein
MWESGDLILTESFWYTRVWVWKHLTEKT